ncbi:MAG: hypothetical protein IPH32_14285 [Bacteroidetes bacterium]|nr:hypothetical protein [Bacteroidota bacterium]
MSSHHDHDNHSAEPKEVAFRTPLIMGLVTILIILLAVSTCDNKHHGSCECKEDCSEECMKKCEAGDHSGHGTEAHGTEHAAEAHEAAPAEEHAAVADTTAPAAHDTTAAPAKVEEHAHH